MSESHLIDSYENGSGKILQILKGLTREDLLAHPVPGKWSIQQVVLHLADSEQVFADRIKRVAFDEKKWTENLHYDAQSAEDAARLIELTRRQISRILRELPSEAFDRQGTHSQAGAMTLASIVKKATDHLEHHLSFIVAKREKLGKMMW
jgi:uncharacterized damage-inducible protein DinB